MYNYGYGYQPMMGFWSFGDIFGHVIGFIIMVAIIVWLIRWLFGWRGGRRGMRWHMMQNGMGHHGAMSVLRERYAKGEISKEEFEEKKKVLME